MLDDGRGSSQEHGAVAHQGKHRACYLPAHLRTHPNGSTQMHALRDLVRDAYPGDAFVFFYAGHCGQEPTTDVREIDGFNEYIVACDQGIILDDTLREILVDTLPAGTRLTVSASTSTISLHANNDSVGYLGCLSFRYLTRPRPLLLPLLPTTPARTKYVPALSSHTTPSVDVFLSSSPGEERGDALRGDPAPPSQRRRAALARSRRHAPRLQEVLVHRYDHARHRAPQDPCG
jgi:hypothetical protein